MEIDGVNAKELAEKYGTPLYVYSFRRILENVDRLKSAFTSDTVPVQIYYSMKANPHPAIVNLLMENGINFDCSSPGEIEVALISGAKPENIIYTGNYESEYDLKFALDRGVQINLDDITSLFRLLRVGKPERISYRINPGEGKGKYIGTTTGGVESKFGVPFERASIAYKNAIDSGINRFGAHMMVGSGILDSEFFSKIVETFLTILGEVHRDIGLQFEFIDIGGGFGIPYYDDEKPLDIFCVGKEVLKVFREDVEKYNLGKPILFIEPGRYIVGDAGYLITRVLGKKEGYKTFVGVDAGINTILRPALYDAQHNIVVVGKDESPKRFHVNVCGQICENTDIIAKERLLPEIEEGDLLVFKEAGAYCSVMTMPYNLRFRPAEVAIIDGKSVEITRREGIEDYISRVHISRSRPI